MEPLICIGRLPRRGFKYKPVEPSIMGILRPTKQFAHMYICPRRFLGFIHVQRIFFQYDQTIYLHQQCPRIPHRQEPTAWRRRICTPRQCGGR